MNNKKILIFVIVIFIVISVPIFLNKNISKNKENINEVKNVINENKMEETKQIKDYEFSNANIYEEDGKFKFSVKVKNITTNNLYKMNITIDLIDKYGKKIGEIDSEIPALNSNSDTTIFAESSSIYQGICDYAITNKD